MNNKLLEKPVHVIHFGLRLFHEELLKQQVPSLFTDWKPPCGGNPKLIEIVERLSATSCIENEQTNRRVPK